VPRSVRRSMLLGAAVCAVLGGSVAVAQASDNDLRTTLNTYAPKIVKDENAVKSGLAGYAQGKVTPLTRALKHEVSLLHALKSKLATESPSSTKGAKAKKDIVNGLGLIASAYGALRHDVVLAHGGPVPAAKVNAAVATDRKGRGKLLRGLKLLGG
jgi:hypothetical protein